MDTRPHVASLDEVLDRVADICDHHPKVSIDAIMDAIGQRSFGPVLLLIGLIVLAPIIGDIPGVPTLCALMVLTISVQLLLHKEHFWLPRWILARSVTTAHLLRAIRVSRKPARFIDRLVKPRLIFLIRGYIPMRCVALSSMAVALMMPLMEFIPFSANLAGAGRTFFGLAVIGREGFLALLAFVFTGASGAVIGWALLG